MTNSHSVQGRRLSRRRFLAALGSTIVAGAFGINSGPVAGNMDPAQLRRSMRDQYGASGVEVIDAWLSLLDRLADRDLDTQLREVNDFFNRRIEWVDDIDVWGQEDYWATPLEALGEGRGDCEDYSIAKYITLTQLGVPVATLRMIYVKARLGRSDTTIAHMVLGYYATPSAEPRILDNLQPSIVPARQRTDLEPVFSFNSEGLWTGSSTSSKADPVARLSRWRRVLARMTEQGFL